jgi:hypothetical protein
MFEDPGTYVMPYLPPQAKTDAENWRRQKKAVFQRVVPTRNEDECKNCHDIRYIYLSFCKAGPFKSAPSTKAIVTYFEGDHLNGEGFYIVKDTVAYPCPHCDQEVPIPA